jgi:hypothetical protein
MITVKNRRAYKGPGEWICRGKSPLGNPFKMGKESDRDEVIEKYKKWFREQQLGYNWVVHNELQRLVELAQKGDLVLICWCAPKACHGDFIKQVIEDILKYEPKC